MKSFIVALTGASGSVYGLRLVEALLKSGSTIHLSISHDGFTVLKAEAGIHLAGKTETEKKIQKYFASKNVHYYSEVVPCSMKTLSAIAHGYANNLIERAADVTVKEGRKLILSPREMPFSAVHLENMLKLSRLGVTIAPPIPAFYHKPKNVNDMVNFVVGKILDLAGVTHTLFKRWE
jgi:4-hydroxy-3-polyprenylbenzoate decarboxylase